MPLQPFSQLLSERGLVLTRGETTTLQVNVGSLCNQRCRHCHLNAGPDSREIMDAETSREVVAFARRGGFKVVDITGGAPEMNPVLPDLIVQLSSFTPKIMLRSNLTAVTVRERLPILDLCREHRVVIVASFPSLNHGQTDSQRGGGVWNKSIAALQLLNSMGYGRQGSGLELHLVSNPAGAFLPPSQCQAERRFREDLEKKRGIVFNDFYSFANVPLGRFQAWLRQSGNQETYMEKLSSVFNPSTVDGLMCRTLVSVSWEGFLFDCDFNLAAGMYAMGERIHVSDMDGPPPEGVPIAVSDHCYACTAGTGFT